MADIILTRLRLYNENIRELILERQGCCVNYFNYLPTLVYAQEDGLANQGLGVAYKEDK